MIIKIHNCNSIDSGEITVQKNVLNIFYAINGTGKSTIVKAISGHNDPEIMDSLRPFKYRNSDKGENEPEILGVDDIKSIKIFDEDYVSKFVFQPNELVKNSFDIFIKTPDYETNLQTINELLQETKDIFMHNPDLEALLVDLEIFSDGFGKAQSGYSKASSLEKALGKGNKTYNIPEGLTPYKEYLQNEVDGTNVKWLGWHLKGNEFSGDLCQCPYCAMTTTSQTKEAILKVSQEFEPKAIEHLNKILGVFKNLEKYFSESTNEKITEIGRTISGISPEQKTYLIGIKRQVDTLKEKLLKIKGMSFSTLKDVGKVVNEISSYKIDMDYLDKFNSEFSQKKINVINSKLDEILQKVTDLQVAVGKQNSTIKTTISQYSKQINSFLDYAGYKYKIILEEDGQGVHKLKLRHNDMEETIDKANLHLSFGERNAFALILFMYDTLNSNPDLIILDDPISSFDGNKKYAIIHKLFQEIPSFKGKTVLLFTHEFSTIIDTIYVMEKKIKAVAKYLENQGGNLIEKEITRDKIKSFSMILRENIELSSNKINKLIYLRRLLEVDGQKKGAWELLSNFFKDDRKIPCMYLSGGVKRDMTVGEIKEASLEICKYVFDFDYDKDYEKAQDKYTLAALYKESNSNYEKLQLYRVINNEMLIENVIKKNVIKKFVNETFHVENDYLFQLNPREYEVVPQYVIDVCDQSIDTMFNGDYSKLPLVTFNVTKKKVQLFDMPAAAGLGNRIEENDSIPILIENVECDFAAKIAGDSMEPTILDKSIVLVKYMADIKEGEIGIFTLNGITYCKEFRGTKLCSINPTGETFEINEYDNLAHQGKIVKIIPPDSINDEIEFM